VRRHQGALVNFFLRSGAYAESEDLAQETFVRLFRYRNRYQATARFSTFLYVLARNVWSDRGRKLHRQERLTEELQMQASIVGETGEAQPGRALDAESALDRLSPKLREVLVLNIYQGLRYQEVADILGIPLGTVKSRINLALQTLRELLHES
jgi:RNA polymerase sigma-70 factor, ECF subfamily